MRFGLLSGLSALASLASLVAGQGTETNENIITIPTAQMQIPAANVFTIQWTPSANPGTVSIILLKGLQTNLQQLDTIAAAIPNSGRFDWTPPVTLEGLQSMPADHIYGFKIVNDITGNFGWSPPFRLDSPQSTFNNGAVTSATTDAPTTATSATTAASTETSASTSTEVSTTASTTSESSSTASSTESSTTASTTESSTTSSASSTTTSASTSASETSSETSSTTSETQAAATETETEEEPSESAAPSTEGGKISTIAIAGISVSVVVAVAIGIGAFFLIRRRRQNSRSKLRGADGSDAPKSKFDDEFQMMERRARHRPTSSFGFNTTRSDVSGSGPLAGRDDPYVTLDGGHGAFGNGRGDMDQQGRKDRDSSGWKFDLNRF